MKSKWIVIIPDDWHLWWGVPLPTSAGRDSLLSPWTAALSVKQYARHPMSIRITSRLVWDGACSMTIITVASSKGGPGKTTLAQLIIGSLAAEDVTVAALDADPTGGLSRWVSRIYEGRGFASHHEPEESRLAHLIHRVAQEVDVVVVDTAGFGNRAATVAMTAADIVLIPMVPGEGDITEAARTIDLVAGVASAARRNIPARVVLNRVRSATALTKHALVEAATLPRLTSGLSDLVAYGEMGFSGRMPGGKAGAETTALLAELRSLGWLPDAGRKTHDINTQYTSASGTP